MVTMVKYGADEIFSSKDSTITDEDIEKILSRGEEKTSAMKAMLEKKTPSQLLNFSIDSGKQSNKEPCC
jgi:SWI/SNF-related matrix-associated actin-dependent regulator of chromatin subfamily A member 5